jgi:hypothetical protein
VFTSQVLFASFSPVYEAIVFSTSSDAPHQVTVIQNVPTVVDCGTFFNSPSSTLRWNVLSGGVPFDVSIEHERATVGLNQSLYLLEPTPALDGSIFSCDSTNAEVGESSTGFLQINIQGKL